MLSLIFFINNKVIKFNVDVILNILKRIFKYCNDLVWLNNLCVGGYFNLNKLSN